MRAIKGLLLAGAAGIISMSAAQAADLPVKAKAAEYVKVCSAYGAGFFYIPGTETCIKLGGYILSEFGINASGSHGVYWAGANARDNKADVANYNNRIRSEVSFDTRTQTEYGTLRSYIRFGPEINTDMVGYPSQFTGYRGTIQFTRAFIQFAGFTVGKTSSFFDFYAGALSYSTPMYAGSFSQAGHGVVAYTAQFGGGFSATISAEEGLYRRTGLVWAGAGGAAHAGATLGQNNSVKEGLETSGAPNFGYYRANAYPDVVANLRLDQPWGSAQINGAIHDVSGGCNGTCTGANSFGSATGYAIGAGVKFNLPFAAGDELWIQATYADGATSYLGPYKSYSTDAVAVVRGYAGTDSGKFTTALLADGAIDANGVVQKTKGYQFTVAGQHFWTPALRTSLFGGYLKLDYSEAGAKAVCAALGTGGAAASKPTPGCNPDVAIWQVGSRTIWTVTTGLDFGVEVLYTKIDQNHKGTFNVSGGANGTGAYNAADVGIWQGNVRVTRSFWP
jgi:hypothetical protein